MEIHKPKPVHTWREFFKEVGIIVLGVCIALAAEQTVEYFHRQHELHDLREALKQEREENRKVYIVNVAQYRVSRVQLENDLRIFEYLRQHPNTPEEKLPGIPNWAIPYEVTITSAWKSAQQSQTLVLLPRQENEGAALFYAELDKGEQAAADNALAGFQVGDYAFADPDPSHLTPAQVENVIESIKTLMFRNWGWGVWLANLGRDNDGFANILSIQEIRSANPSFLSAEKRQQLPEAASQTQQAVGAARAALAKAKKATGLD